MCRAQRGLMFWQRMPRHLGKPLSFALCNPLTDRYLVSTLVCVEYLSIFAMKLAVEPYRRPVLRRRWPFDNTPVVQVANLM
jgi:hypothetical protein